MQTSTEEVDYSIVICVYNPDKRILQRCLESVHRLDKTDLQVEVIIADNNSSSPMTELGWVLEYQKKIAGLKIIRIKQQGVKFARIAAIQLSKGKYIVYIDSDNEPEPDYLQQLKWLNQRFPEVGAWGPGDVTVDFIDGVDSKIENYARTAFQEKHFKDIAFGGEHEWQLFYPVGTGLCTQSSILKDYARLAGEGRFSLKGRTGELLSSGEDTEMVLLAISKGFFAGSSPSLKLKHIIPSTRANIAYLRRLTYGTASCYETSLLEVFPAREEVIKNKILSAFPFIRRALKKFASAGFGSKPLKTFELADWLGLQTGSYNALNKPVPAVVEKIIKILKLT